MRFRDRLAFVLGYVPAGEKAGGINAPGWARAGINGWTDQPDLSVMTNQLNLMGRLSWVNIAVTVTSQTAAGVPFEVKQRVGEDTTAIENHPFELLLERPNPMQSRFEFLEALFGYRRLSGNAYLWLNRRNESTAPSELWLIPPHRMRPVPDPNLYLRGYEYDPGGGASKILLETWEVAHFKRWHPGNRYIGLSPIEALANGVSSDLAMQEWNHNYFGKDNAKIPGILAFADPIIDSDWERLKTEVAEKHGGTERRTMMLRNAGKGGVQWISTGITQKDMEFLQGRQFTKEEIFAALAPGLSSVLAINATEANAIAGDATFMNRTIWPDLTAVAEKITNDILPSYGDNLKGEFEDVRIKDRAMALQEETNSFKYMTVAEVRAEHGLEALGDERDDKLVDGPGETPPQLQDFNNPPPNVQVSKPDIPMLTEGQNGKQMPAGKAVIDVTPLDPLEDELNKWRRKAVKAVKRGKSAAVDFESDEIPEALAESIAGSLEAVQAPEQVQAIFTSAIQWRAYP